MRETPHYGHDVRLSCASANFAGVGRSTPVYGLETPPDLPFNLEAPIRPLTLWRASRGTVH